MTDNEPAEILRPEPDYRTAEKLDLRAIEDHFEAKGYTVQEIDQLWRNVHARLERNGALFFLKLASTPHIGISLGNEIAWNKQLTDLAKNEALPFQVPIVSEEGMYHQLPYYLSSFHGGDKLVDHTAPDATRIAAWLPKVVATNRWLLETEAHLILPKDQELTGNREELVTRYLKRIRGWHEQLTPENQEALRPLLEETERDFLALYTPGLNHGDFVPWHMLEEGEQFVLIDAEHASTKTPRFYDIAYFYHRLATKAHLPDLATQYLAMIEEHLPPADQAIFRPAFRHALGTRIIGGFYDAKLDGASDEPHQQLLEAFNTSPSLSGK